MYIFKENREATAMSLVSLVSPATNVKFFLCQNDNLITCNMIQLNASNYICLCTCVMILQWYLSLKESTEEFWWVSCQPVHAIVWSVYQSRVTSKTTQVSTTGKNMIKYTGQVQCNTQMHPRFVSGVPWSHSGCI